MTRAQILLEKGYFPSQLPPCFSTEELAKKSRSVKKKLNSALPKGPQGQFELELFSVARSAHNRRVTALVNPIPQFYLADHIASGWKRLETHFKRSQTSLSTPILSEDDSRAISITPIKVLSEQKIIRSAGHRYVLISDISQFFPTLYTHVIAWALEGKAKAKAKLTARKKKKSYGDKLDFLITRCQHWQTAGIPIGPDTSHIIAELVGTAIDEEIVQLLGYVPSGFRYVDDFYFFFDSYSEAEKADACLNRALRTFELKQNSLKTKILPLNRLVEDSWTHTLQGFQFSNSKKQQRRDINHFFDTAYKISSDNSDENVMKFAVKKLQSIIVKKDNWELFEAYLCRVVLTHPNTLQDVAHILVTYHFHKFNLNLTRIGATLFKLIEEHAQLEHHSEVVWALWLCLELELKLPKTLLLPLIELNSSPSLILALDMEKKGLLEERFKKTMLRKHVSKRALYGNMWLLSYEAGIRKWITKSDNHITSDPLFSILNTEDISFYNPKIKLKPIFTRTHLSMYDPFETDIDVSDDFEFIDLSEDYLDKPRYIEDPDTEGFDFEDDIPF